MRMGLDDTCRIIFFFLRKCLYIHAVDPHKRCFGDAGLMTVFNSTALRKAKIVCNFGLSECNWVNMLRTDRN